METTHWPTWLDWVPEDLQVWDAWVAIGTLALAAATILLALSTRALVRRTQDDVRTSEAALEAAIRPVLVEVPLGMFVRQRRMFEQDVEDDQGEIDVGVWDDRELIIELPLRNAGSGIALIGEPRLQIDVGPLSWEGVALSTAVPAGELTRVDFKGTWPDPESLGANRERIDADGFEFTVEVPYTDVDGRQATVTRLFVRHRLRENVGEDDDEAWLVDRLDLLREGEAVPFATLTGRARYVAHDTSAREQSA